MPVESQLLVYSKTSLQQRLITPERPRAIYFNDELALGAVHGGVIEIAVQDAKQGAVFYTLETTDDEPRLQRQGTCLGCHYSLATLGVPGFFARSVPTAVDGRTLPWLGNATVSHATPLAERWGGWYVTGDVGANDHLGNALLARQPLAGAAAARAHRPRGSAGAFPSRLSDAVQRCRGASRVRPPARDDERVDARRLGLPSRARGEARSRHARAHDRRRRRVSAVRRRSEARAACAARRGSRSCSRSSGRTTIAADRCGSCSWTGGSCATR